MSDLVPRLAWILAWACVAPAACARGSAKPAAERNLPAADAPAAIEIDAEDQWGEVGCTPSGDELRYEGTYRVDPPTDASGKHLRGEWLEADDGTRWLVTYAGGRFHPELSDRRVEARGRACAKEGQAVYAKHFALSSLRVLHD